MLKNTASDKTDTAQLPPSDETKRQYYFMEKCREIIEEKSKKKGCPLTACVNTFGCQMNARDSEKLTGALELMGYKITDDENADFVIYNTCTVRENANLKVYGRLGYLSRLKKKNNDMLIALCGCMMQEPSVVEKIKKSYGFIDIIFGTHNIFKFAEIVYNRLNSDRLVIDLWENTDIIIEDLPVERKYPFKSGVNIMFGCDNFCSYCIVPYVRGRERSRKPDDIIGEIKRLAEDGVVEVMLLGQNVNSYGKTLENPISFARLLKEVEKTDGIERIRFMTSHPKDLSDELIEVMKSSKKICKQLHLPVQAGSSRILKIMNRKYDKEHYLKLVDKIRRAIPDISLTTDIMVGFPGETEEDFLETLDVVKKAQFDSAYTFIYSKRTGTPAAAMEEQIPKAVVKERFDRLLREIQTIANRRIKRFEGEALPVLVEEKNGQLEGFVTGKLDSGITVHFKGDAALIGRIVNVRLKEAKGFYYIGEMTEEN